MSLLNYQRYKIIYQCINTYLRCVSSKAAILRGTEIDALDTFTSSLVLKRSNKYQMTKLKKKSVLKSKCELLKMQYMAVELDVIPQNDLDKIFIGLMENENLQMLKNFLVECRKYHRCPGVIHILTLLDSQQRSIDLIKDIKETVASYDNDTYINNGMFDHYLAEILWLNGDEMKAIELFQAVYTQNNFLRRKIRAIMKHLTIDITNKSEAVLVKVMQFGEQISDDFRDCFILLAVWEACFLSEWFVDQQLALEILEKHYNVKRSFSTRIPYIVSLSLKEHKTDNIYRLLEILLKYNLESEYVSVMYALFDYRYKQGDLSSCKEIIKWLQNNNVTVSKSIQVRFLSLLIDKGSTMETIVERIKAPNYKF